MIGIWACLMSSVLLSLVDSALRALEVLAQFLPMSLWSRVMWLLAMGALQALQVLHHRTAERWGMAVSSCGSIHAGNSFQTVFCRFVWYRVRNTAIQIIFCNVTMQSFIMQKESKTIKSIHLYAVIPRLNHELTGG